MTVHALSIRRHRMLAGIGIAVVAVSSLLFATPAQAGSARFSISIGSRPSIICEPVVSNPVCRPVYQSRPSHAEIEFSRGLERGECEGFDAGFRDGLAGRHFCPDVSTCSGSRYYRDGFERGFTKGYAAGFEKGRCERIERERRARLERDRQRHGHAHGHAHGHIHGRWARR